MSTTIVFSPSTRSHAFLSRAFFVPLPNRFLFPPARPGASSVLGSHWRALCPDWGRVVLRGERIGRVCRLFSTVYNPALLQPIRLPSSSGSGGPNPVTSWSTGPPRLVCPPFFLATFFYSILSTDFPDGIWMRVLMFFFPFPVRFPVFFPETPPPY